MDSDRLHLAGQNCISRGNLKFGINRPTRCPQVVAQYYNAQLKGSNPAYGIDTEPRGQLNDTIREFTKKKFQTETKVNGQF